MEKLRAYLNSLPKDARARFCLACGTSEGYLRKAISRRQQLGEGLCILIDRESAGAVCCEDLSPNTDWAYLRASNRLEPEQVTA